MANVASQVVEAFFQAQDLKVDVIDDEGTLRTGFAFQGGRMSIFINFSEDGSHVSVQGFDFVSVPKEKFDIMYKCLNEVNKTYKHFKYYLVEELGQIFVQDDDIIQLDTCGEECFELVLRMVHITEEAFPILMKALWA